MVLKHIYLYPDLVEFINTRPNDLYIIRDQTRSICNFLERQLVKRKFKTEGFNRICIVGYSNVQEEMYINSCKVLSIPILFNIDECRQTPQDKLDDYYAKLLIVGLKRCATKYQISLDEMLVWLDDLKQNGYINKWIFKERTFRELRVKCHLECMLTKEAFTLRLVINREGSSLFDEVILTTAPDEIIFYNQFKDIIVKNNEVVVTDRFGGSLFRISIRKLLHNSNDS